MSRPRLNRTRSDLTTPEVTTLRIYEGSVDVNNSKVYRGKIKGDTSHAGHSYTSSGCFRGDHRGREPKGTCPRTGPILLLALVCGLRRGLLPHHPRSEDTVRTVPGDTRRSSSPLSRTENKRYTRRRRPRVRGPSVTSPASVTDSATLDGWSHGDSSSVTHGSTRWGHPSFFDPSDVGTKGPVRPQHWSPGREHPCRKELRQKSRT